VAPHDLFALFLTAITGSHDHMITARCVLGRAREQ
jgi:hypothetical protein